jgi:hypothetical protein
LPNASYGKKFAGRTVRLEFYCKDMAGHLAFRATIEADYGDQELAENANLIFMIENRRFHEMHIAGDHGYRPDSKSNRLFSGRATSGSCLVLLQSKPSGRLVKPVGFLSVSASGQR